MAPAWNRAPPPSRLRMPARATRPPCVGRGGDGGEDDGGGGTPAGRGPQRAQGQPEGRDEPAQRGGGHAPGVAAPLEPCIGAGRALAAPGLVPEQGAHRPRVAVRGAHLGRPDRCGDSRRAPVELRVLAGPQVLAEGADLREEGAGVRQAVVQDARGRRARHAPREQEHVGGEGRGAAGEGVDDRRGDGRRPRPVTVEPRAHPARARRAVRGEEGDVRRPGGRHAEVARPAREEPPFPVNDRHGEAGVLQERLGAGPLGVDHDDLAGARWARRSGRHPRPRADPGGRARRRPGPARQTPVPPVPPAGRGGSCRGSRPEPRQSAPGGAVEGQDPGTPAAADVARQASDPSSWPIRSRSLASRPAASCARRRASRSWISTPGGRGTGCGWPVQPALVPVLSVALRGRVKGAAKTPIASP